MDKSTSEDVICPAEPQRGCGQVLSGQVVASKVMEDALDLNLKLTPSESFQGDGSIFKAFVHGKVICTKVLAVVLPAVTVKGGERDDDGNEEVLLQNDTLLSFNIIAREMVSLRGDADLDVDTDHTIGEKSVKLGQHIGDDRDCDKSVHSAMGDDGDSVGGINRGSESDRDTLTDHTNNDSMVKDTQQPRSVPTTHKAKVRGKALKQRSVLMKHQPPHEKYKYTCSFDCGAFTTREHLATHMKIHTRPSTRDHICKVCSKGFFDAKSLDTHQSVHNTEKPFKCMQCDKTYKLDYMLERHVARFHSEFHSITQQNMRVQADTCTIDEICVKSETSIDDDMPIGNYDSEEFYKTEESQNISDGQSPTSMSLQRRDSEIDEELSDHDTHTNDCDAKDYTTTKDGQQPRSVPAKHKCRVCGKAFESNLMLTKHQVGHEKYKYACPLGCRSFTTRTLLKTHMRLHTHSRDHKCKVCSKGFFDASSLEAHEFIHTTEKPFKCTHCDKSYTKSYPLKMHVLTEHVKFRPNTQPDRIIRKHKLDPENHKYACSFGCRSFATERQLATHMSLHTRTRDHVCTICSKAFFKASTLETHQLIHSTEKPFKCTHCDKAYTMRNSLKIHLLTHKVKMRSYKCDICGKLSALKQMHERHILTHSIVEVFQCEVCGKQFKAKSGLRSHKNTHKAYYPCDQCDKSYQHLQYLEVHKKTHTGENLLQCELCGDWFSDPYYFKRHQRIYCKEKLNIQCEICGRSFPDNRYLVSHMGLHSGERPFGCDVCGKAFAKPDGLAYHVKRHNPETEFRCRFCGRFCITKSELRKHEFRHKQRKRHVRLPEEVKPGRRHPETTVGHGETSKPDQAAGAELGTQGIEEIAYTVTDTSGGNGQVHQQIVPIGNGGDGDQRPQPIVTYDENVANHPMVIYVGDGAGQIPQSMAIYIDHAV